MAELNAPIIAKASATAGEVPLASDLEVAEIAVNTADGKLFTKHTDDSIKEISGSGGGGAVDSVNGETGTVSLGIQEMDDFELNTNFYEWSNKANEGDTTDNRSCPNPGDWASLSSQGQTFIYLHNDSTSQLLVVGETVTLTIETGESFTGVIATNTTSQSSWVMGFASESALYPIRDASVGTSLTITSSALPGGAIASLAEGDILQWNNAGQKFKPASLGIQDMDDFGLTQQVTTSFSWDYQGTLGGSIPSEGNCQKLSGYYTSRCIFFSTVDNSGKNVYDLTLGMTTSDVITASINGVQVWSGSGGDWGDLASSTLHFSLIFPDLNDVTGVITAGDALTLEVTGWSIAEDVSLADGDVLVYNAADQEWNPQQPGNDFGTVSPYTEVLGTYATRHGFNAQPPEGTWTANTASLIFPRTAGNGLDLGAEFGATNPGTLGVSEDGHTFTYYTCTNWEDYGTYYRATLTGFDAQVFYDVGDRPIWVNFGPQQDPLEGMTLVYDAVNDYFKIKKNEIANQSDFDYQRDTYSYSYTFDVTDTANPPSGTATSWSGYDDRDIFLSTTDRDSLDAETDLYAFSDGDPVVMSVNDSIVFDGNLASPANKNGNRISLRFPVIQDWITNLQAGDVVGIKSNSVFTRKSAPLPIEDGQVLTWVDANSQWEPAQLPVVINKTTLQAELAASTDFADFQSRIAAL